MKPHVLYTLPTHSESASAAETICHIFYDQAGRYGNRYKFLTARFDRQGRPIDSFVSRTWEETKEEVIAVARGLIALGVNPGDRVAIFSESRPRWIISDLAIQTCGAISVPLYPSLADEELSYMITHSESQFVIVSNLDKAHAVLRVTQGQARPVIIMMSPHEGEQHLGVYTFGDVMVRGQQIPMEMVEARLANATPDDLISIIYTSGTTGRPKGVMLTQRNFVANIRQCTASELIQYTRQLDPHLQSLVHLPLCHVYGRTCDYHVAGLYLGGELVFAESYYSLERDLREVRPHVIATIPRLFEKIYEIVTRNLPRVTPLQRSVFRWAMKQGQRYVAGFATGKVLWPHELFFYGLANVLVFERLKKRMGFDRLVYAISGGGKLAPEIAVFVRSLGIQLSEGYGLTETSPVINFNAPELIMTKPRRGLAKYVYERCLAMTLEIMVVMASQGKSPFGNSIAALKLIFAYYVLLHKLRIKPGSVGRPVIDTEERLAPDGEILVRGPQVFSGYWRDPEATATAFTPDGFFKTGDIGRFDEEGFLEITDRKKDLFVTSGGKNIAPNPIEMALISRPLIDQACLIGDGKKYITALIVPDFDSLKRVAKERGISYETMTELVSHPDIRALIAQEVEAVNAGLARHEQVKYFSILDKPFDISTGELTHTLKVKRRVVLEKYRDLIENMYSNTPP